MDKSLEEEGIPHSVTEDILKYLEETCPAGEDEVKDYPQDDPTARVRSILENLIKNIADRAQCLEEFDALLKSHNQYPLFELGNIIPDFEIDDELYEKLTFRETLIISNFKGSTNSYIPNICGGFCLDIQKAKGASPLSRKDLGYDHALIEFITAKLNALNKIKNATSKHLHEEGPNPSEASLDVTTFLSKTDINSIMVSESEKELKDFISTIKPRYERLFCKFLVHLSSQFDIDGQNAGSRMTTWVDRNLHTLEEKRTEYLIANEEIHEKKLYCALQARRYFVKHKSTPDDLIDRKYYSMGKTHNLVCEGANFLLMRYLAITRYIGNFELSTMYINGDMCRNIYECTGPESGMVNDEKLDLCRIYRTIVEECGIEHRCITILTLHGQIVKQEWDDCDYILQINPLAQIENMKPVGNERLLLSKMWEGDMQLFSAFLDCKTSCSMQIRSYLADHPEFKNMMADYVQATLMMKPEEVLDFTIQYFSQHFSQDIFKNVGYGGNDDDDDYDDDDEEGFRV